MTMNNIVKMNNLIVPKLFCSLVPPILFSPNANNFKHLFLFNLFVTKTWIYKKHLMHILVFNLVMQSQLIQLIKIWLVPSKYEIMLLSIYQKLSLLIIFPNLTFVHFSASTFLAPYLYKFCWWGTFLVIFLKIVIALQKSFNSFC